MAKRPAFSNLMKQIKEGTFVFTGELEPEKDFDINHVLHSAEEMKKTGKIVAANVTDGPQGDAYTCSMVPSYLVQEKVGLETEIVLLYSVILLVELFLDLKIF